MNNLKIFWIDDEFKKNSRLRDYATKHGLDLFGVRSVEEIGLLEKEYWEFDAVLLDVNILPSKDSHENPSSVYGNKAIKRINSIKEKKFPIVIYSGVGKTLEGEDSFKDYNNEYEVFDKNDRNGYKKCIEELMKLAKNQPLNEIKHRHKDFFELNNNLVPENCKNQILTILADKNGDYKGYLNTLRTVVEDGFFGVLEKNELIPRVKGLSNRVNLVSGEVIYNYELREKIPVKIKAILKFIIRDFTNTASHTFKYAINNMYLIHGACYLTMDLWIWLDGYFSIWKKNNWNEFSENGKITSLKGKYGFLKSKDFPDGVIFYYNHHKDIDFDESQCGKKVKFYLVKDRTIKEEQEKKYIAKIIKLID